MAQGAEHTYYDMQTDAYTLRRAQVEQLHGRCVLTGQEAPECNRKFREDLFKKFCSGDAISGRKPYGMRTRMIHVIGFKRGLLSVRIYIVHLSRRYHSTSP